ncbi:MAG: hypothetical protein J0L66_08080 [Cytophagales bacterium]|nr:hypothetical protein [Cytophagales bacterium]
MNWKKAGRRVNGGLAIYYGMGAAIGAIAMFVTLLVWIIKAVMGKIEFEWSIPVLASIFILVMGVVAYLLLKVGYDEIEQ